MIPPTQLRKPQFKFILLGRWNQYRDKDYEINKKIYTFEPKTKEEFDSIKKEGFTSIGKTPLEPGWNLNRSYVYADPKLINHISNGGNYGVRCGNGLSILDVDDMAIIPELDKIVPETLTIETGSKKQHRYYIVPAGTPKIVLTKNKVHYGELQGPGSQCVGAGSRHPIGGNEYKVIKDIEIAELSQEIIDKIKENYTDFKDEPLVKSPDWNQYNKTNISDLLSITSLVSLGSMKKTGDEYFGSHPVHGSTTGMNFFINPSKNLWHCFRCASGGDSLSFLALKEGVCDCNDFSASGKKLKGKDFIEVKKIAKEKYGVKIPEKELELTPLKNIKVELGKSVKTIVSVLDMTSGESMVTSYRATCPECGKSKIVFDKTPLTCARTFSDELERENKRGCCYQDGKKQGQHIKVDIEEIHETGYVLNVYDPKDTGNNMQITSIFLRNDLVPNDYKSKMSWEGDLLIKSLIVNAKIGIFQAPRKKFDDWFLYVDSYEFEVKKEDVNYNLIKKFEGIPRDKKFFAEYFAPRIYDRTLTKKIYAVNLISPLKIRLPNKEVDYAIINCMDIGDAGQSKTQLGKEVLKYAKGTNSKFITVENATNRGLLGSVVKNQTNDSWTVKVGEIPKASNGLVVLDGYSKLNPEDMTQLRGILEERELQILKAGGLKKECPVRVIMLGNIVKDVEQYQTKHQASFDMGATESDFTNKFSGPDRRRIHHVLVIADSDTDVDKIETHISQQYNPTKLKEIEEYWSNLRAFAWSRKVDDFIWEEGIIDYIREKMKEIRKRYPRFSMKYGVLSKGGLKMFTIQLPAVAILHESFNSENKTLINKSHVDWLYNLYLEELNDLGLETENALNDIHKVHAVAIGRVCPQEIKEILLLLHKFGGNQTAVEKSKTTNRMRINRALNQVIEYELKHIRGTKKHWYKLNEGSGEQVEFSKGKIQFIPDMDLPPMTKKGTGGFTEFGRLLVGEILKLKRDELLKDRIIGIPDLEDVTSVTEELRTLENYDVGDVTSVTGVTPKEDISNENRKNMEEVIQSNTKSIEIKQNNVSYTKNSVTDVTSVTKEIVSFNDTVDNSVTDVTKEGDIELNEDFKKAINLMENTNNSLFITGKAGTGKSTLLKYFANHTKKNVAVVAPTGLAAINVGGQTIHSFFGFPPKMLDESDIQKVYRDIYNKLDAVIIDEVSMVRADMFDAIDKFLRLNGREPSKPFGGVQMLLFGDLYQLPPVVEKDMGEVMNKIYKSPYFFDAKVMKYFNFDIIKLKKVYRQTDSTFIEFLDKVRLGNIDAAALELINARADKTKQEESIIITPTNSVADFINNEKLGKLQSKLYNYKAKVEGDFKLGITNLPIDLELNLKKDARVIFVKNDTRGRWVNGTLGKVEELGKQSVKVRLDEDSSIVDVQADDWEKIKYSYDRKTGRIIANIVGKISQIPLRLAWALTIHKCQGQTLDKAHIDLSSGVWEFGHSYVALGRCKTLDGITLETKIRPSDIKVDFRVTEFLKSKHTESLDDY
ncbi:MAG: AAA family ATPase [Candidatus Pacearchaeota archaeon]